jgi:hypothetical protein
MWECPFRGWEKMVAGMQAGIVEPAMNDGQILSVAVMVVTVLAGGIYNNVRIGDVSKRIDDMRDLLRAEIAKNQSEILHAYGNLDAHLTKIEERFIR